MAASRAPWRFESRGGVHEQDCLPAALGLWLAHLGVRPREYDARSLQAHPHLHLWLSCRAERGAGLDSGH